MMMVSGVFVQKESTTILYIELLIHIISEHRLLLGEVLSKISRFSLDKTVLRRFTDLCGSRSSARHAVAPVKRKGYANVADALSFPKTY